MSQRILVSAVIVLTLTSWQACSRSAPDGPGGADADSESTVAPAGSAPRIVAASDYPADVNPESRARLPLPRRDAFDADGQRAFDIVVNSDSRYAEGLNGPIAMWLYSPGMAEHYFPGSTYVRYGTDKDQRLTELAILVTARELRSQYVWSAHEPAGLREGLDAEIIDIVKRRADLETGAPVPGFGERERTIVRFVREAMTQERVSAETFRLARDLFGERGVMDLVGLMGHYNLVVLTARTFDVQRPVGSELLLPNLW